MYATQPRTTRSMSSNITWSTMIYTFQSVVDVLPSKNMCPECSMLLLLQLLSVMMQQWSTQGLVRIVGSTLSQGYGWSQKEAGRGQGWAFVEGFGNAPEEIIWVDHVDPKTSLESVYLNIKHWNLPSWAAQDFSSTKTKNVCLSKWWISANLSICYMSQNSVESRFSATLPQWNSFFWSHKHTHDHTCAFLIFTWPEY